jgi:hypothetical protein
VAVNPARYRASSMAFALTLSDAPPAWPMLDCLTPHTFYFRNYFTPPVVMVVVLSCQFIGAWCQAISATTVIASAPFQHDCVMRALQDEKQEGREEDRS